jgi:PhnB protein
VDARDDRAMIRDLVDRWVAAMRAKDVEKVLALYTSDALVFDLAPPLQHDRDDMRRGLEAWFPTWRGAIGYEVRDLEITCGDDVAFSHSLNRLSGTRTNGEATDVWFRATIGYRKVGARWLVAHEHVSVPFYMDGSYRASVELKP